MFHRRITIFIRVIKIVIAMSFVQKYIKSNGSYEPKICGQVKIAGRLKSRTSSDFKNILKKIVGNKIHVIALSRKQT